MNLRNKRHRPPLGRLELAMVLAIYGFPGCSGIELAGLADVTPRVGYVMVSRLRRKRLVRSRPRGGLAEHDLTNSGTRLAEAWMHFLRALGPELRKRLAFE